MLCYLHSLRNVSYKYAVHIVQGGLRVLILQWP